MNEGGLRYVAYLVRLWQVGNAGEGTWRAMVESPHTGEKQWFIDLEALFAFLREATDNRDQIEI